MRSQLMTAAVLVSVACAEAPGGGGNSASGSVAVSRDDALVYAVDSDLDTLFVYEPKTGNVSKIAVGHHPERLLVAPDDTVFVANRFGRSVSVVRKGDTAVSVTVPVGIEPMGLAVSTDGRTLFVVNSATRENLDVGSVMAFDTKTFTLQWESFVGHEPRAITLLANGTALVSLFKDGEVVTVDTKTGAIVKGSADLFAKLNATELRNDTPFTREFGAARQLPTRRPRAVDALTSNPEGTQVYAAALLSTDAELNTRPPSAGGSPSVGGGSPTGFGGGVSGRGGFAGGASFPDSETSSGYGAMGPCGLTLPSAAPALLTFDGEGEPLVDDLSVATGCAPSQQDERPPMLLFGPPDSTIQGPTAVAVDSAGTFLFVASRESNSLAIVPTATVTDTGSTGFANSLHRRSPFDSMHPAHVARNVRVGGGPTGVAVSRDGKTAWVFNSFDHSLSQVSNESGTLRETRVVPLGADVLPPDVVEGRRLFFSATDPRMNNPQLGISCSTCHIEAREDGHIWNTTEGPRNTPSLIGKKLDRTAPFHWNGEFQTVSQFMLHTTRDRMGGQGPSDVMEKQLMAFIMSVPTPDNPLTTETPGDVLARGKAAFDKAECGSCHTGETMTDNKFYDVGTLVRAGPVQDRAEFLFHGGLNTPSLLGIARTAPFLHDGSAPTLKARILIGKQSDKHGKTSRLSDVEVDDLVAYVNSL